MMTFHQYIEQLEKELQDHPERIEIITEITDHIKEAMAEQVLPEKEAIAIIVNRFGSPQELAASFRQASLPSPYQVKGLFILFNMGILMVGIGITLGHHLGNIPFFHWAWQALAQNSWWVLLVYTVYWSLIGYLLGKEFGNQGKKLLIETVRLSILPNLCVMMIVLYGIMPMEWFRSFLTAPFFGACLIATILFYPISQAGFYFGKQQAL
ncbi:HAAS signaling domain-containing protein [Lederbergia galactosidilytica]|nr:hypothetical protein [Lederbergia galactosidilytica]KRG16168.1 hypothetical protein ACA30_02530 [Virgibacillus soli]MBP1914027.1 hypothetical protein [Lederbergia galactosidilytica]OAK75599.1 hypothetical protein ABB05_01175 [Lederbergia galactosidilytica]